MTFTEKRQKVKREDTEWAPKFRGRGKKKGDLVQEREKRNHRRSSRGTQGALQEEGKEEARRFESSVTCLNETEDASKRTVTGGSEDVANMDKGHFTRAEVNSSRC